MFSLTWIKIWLVEGVSAYSREFNLNKNYGLNKTKINTHIFAYKPSKTHGQKSKSYWSLTFNMWWLLKEPFVFCCELHVRGCQLMAHLRFPYQILHPFHLLRRHCLAPLHRWRHPRCRQAHWRWRLKGLFRHLSKGWRTGVRPPGITATSILRRCNASFTDSVRWARKESQTNSDRSPVGFLGMQVRIHSFTPIMKERIQQSIRPHVN